MTEYKICHIGGSSSVFTAPIIRCSGSQHCNRNDPGKLQDQYSHKDYDSHEDGQFVECFCRACGGSCILVPTRLVGCTGLQGERHQVVSGWNKVQSCVLIDTNNCCDGSEAVSGNWPYHQA